MQAKDLFLALESSPIAPDEDFDRFVVGDLLDQSFGALRLQVSDMVSGGGPSRLQLIVGENGNGKTLLANRLKRYLSEQNETQTPAREAAVVRKFDILYSHISALGKASSQTSLEIATNLRRSQLEEPGITYSLIAVQIAKAFAVRYRPPFYWRLLTLTARGVADFFSAGVFTKFEEALRDQSADQIRSELDGITEKLQKKLNSNYYRAQFDEFIGELVAFDPFVKTYFYRSGAVGVHRLRADFLNEVNRTSSLEQPWQVAAQIASLGRQVGCRLVVMIIDDCNQVGFVEQLMPLINDLPKFTDPKIFLIVNMVQSVAEQIENSTGDMSVGQRLFYKEPIRLSGPGPHDVEALYGRLRTLYNEAFLGAKSPIPDTAKLRSAAARAWSQAIDRGSIEPNYRSAIRLLINRLRQLGAARPAP
jgi:hypothetical protein